MWGRPEAGAAMYLVLRVLDRFLQILVPPRRTRACFLSIPDHTDSPYYVYRHLVRTRQGLELVWLVGDDDAADTIHREFERLTQARPDHGHRLRVEQRRSLAGYLLYLRCGVVFHSHGAYAFSTWAFRRVVVNLWHGMPIKAIGHLNERTSDRKFPFGTMQVATSSMFRYVVAAAFDSAPSDVHVTGLPRCDALRFEAARAQSTVDVRDGLGVPSDRRLVLWMPTYRAQDRTAWVHQGRLARFAGASGHVAAANRSFLDDLQPWMLDEIDRASERHGCTVLVKLHHLDALNRAPARPELAHVRFLTATEFLASGVQLYDLLAASDALLSDLSSVIIDYLVTDRPIGLLDFSEEAYERDLLLPMDWFRSSVRFDALRTRGEVDAFFGAVARGERRSPGELVPVMHEALSRSSADLVLDHVGM